MVYRYSWRDDANYAADAQRVGERLAALARDSEGTLHAKDVVADARRQDSPLHALFEWDDRKAAIAHRLHQAHEVIKRIVVHVSDETTETTARYVGATGAEARRETYVCVELAPDARFARVPAAERARQELLRWIHRYNGQPGLEDAVSHAREALEAITGAELAAT